MESTAVGMSEKRSLGSGRSPPAAGHAGPGSEGDSGAAFVALLSPLMADLTLQYTELLTDPAPEAVHRLRKALRRVRALLGLFGHEFEVDSASWVDSELKWTTRQLGAVRDIDVLRARIEADQSYHPDTRAEDLIGGHLSRLRADAIGRATLSLRSARAVVLLAGLPAWIEQCAQVLAACTALDDCVTPTLQQYDARMRELGRRLKTQGRVQRHRLRSAIKRLRYALEAFPILSERNQAYADALTELHVVLGEMNDDAIGARLLSVAVGQEASGKRLRHRPQIRKAQWVTLLAAWRKLHEARPDFASPLRTIT